MPKPKNTVTKSQLIAQLRRVKAETAELRRKTRHCRCAPMSKRSRNEKIEEICKMVSHFQIEDFDPEKLRARREMRETLDAPREGNQSRAGLAGKDKALH